ncbi:MAG: hypothetical protein HFJ01_14110 [Lachnospiraceae bacterium]|nr:hypothetical protein [Lachnospiraceae bacterium]
MAPFFLEKEGEWGWHPGYKTSVRVRTKERYNMKSGFQFGFFIAWKECAFIYEEMLILNRS